MLCYGKIESPESICAKIDAVTPEDLIRVATNFLNSKSSLVVPKNAFN